MTVFRDQRLWGAGALAFVTVLGLLAAMVYVSPPGDKILSFYTDDVSSISPGIPVRIAGVTVGKIKDLSIKPDQVRVRATVNGSTFVGDQSQVQVRMLTVVGGYYVYINSLGNSPLGDRAIPRDRVVLPYNLMRTLADTTKVTEQVQTAPINQSLNEVQRALTGPNIEVISSIVDAGTKFIETLERQRGQVSAIFDLSEEYVEQLSNFREEFALIIEKISVVEQTLVLYGKGFEAAVRGLGDIAQRGIVPLDKFYTNHREKFIAKVIHWQQIARNWADRAGWLVGVLQRTRDRMQRTLDAQDVAPELLATDLCIPLPESPC